MLKFLRKYNKIILVVGGVILMIAFLLPQTLQQVGQTGLFEPTAMKIGGSKIKASKFFEAQKESQLAAMFGQPNEGPEHWILLRHAAQEGGYIADKGDGQSFFASMNDQLIEAGQPTLDDSLFMSRLGLSPDSFHQGLANIRGVRRMINTHFSAPQYSRQRLAGEGRRHRDSVRADHVFIPSTVRVDEIADPDEETILAFFEENKDNLAAEGDFGIGYILPPRVKVEWLSIKRDALREQVKPDPVELRYRFRQRYADDTVFETDAERTTALNEVRDAFIDELTDKSMLEAERAILAEVERARRKLPDDSLGFKLLPDDWQDQMSTLESLAASTQERVSSASNDLITLPDPGIERRTDVFLTQAELFSLPDIGRAFVQRAGRTLRFGQLAFDLRELNPEDGSGQMGILNGPLIDTTGNMFFFRVLDSRTESAPDSIEEVREAVVSDWKRVQAYEQLKQELEVYIDLAKNEGLDAVADLVNESAPEDAAPIASRPLFSQRNRTFAQNLDSQDFRDALFAVADMIDPTEDPEEVAAADRTVGGAIDKSLGIAIAVVSSWRPLVLEQFRTDVTRASLASTLNSQTLDAENNFFSKDNLVQRYDVTFPNEEEDAGADEDLADEGGAEEESA